MLYAEKDFNLPEHPEIEGVSNLEVRPATQQQGGGGGGGEGG